MQILRLLAARRSAASAGACEGDDEGPFFDLDFASCSLRGSSFGSSSGTDSDSDQELDFVISLQRSRSASETPKFCASEPPARANSMQSSQQHCAGRKRLSLRTLSFGARKAAPLCRRSFARSSSSASARSLRFFMASPHPDRAEHEHERAAQAAGSKRAPSRDVIRRCLAKISRRIRTAASPRAEARGLRKCRSASSAVVVSSRDDDSAAEKQDGIAGAIAHCKESIHRASMSDCGSPLLRSRSDPGKCEVASEEASC